MDARELAAIKERAEAALVAEWRDAPQSVVTLVYDAVPALVAEVERLRAGIQREIDDCGACGGEGVVSLMYGDEPDMDTCPHCLPLRQLLSGT